MSTLYDPKGPPELRLQAIIDRCEFNDWIIILHFDGERPYLQVHFKAACNVHGGELCEQSGRKWFLSYHMTDSEVVGTAFLAVKTAVEHEVREQFKFMNQPIYKPHYNVYELHNLAMVGLKDKRDDIPTAGRQGEI